MSTTTTSEHLTHEVRALLAAVRARGDEVVGRLADPDPAWQTAVTTVVLSDLGGLAAVLWDRGWQPADLLRQAGRDKTPGARDLVGAVLVDQARSYRDHPQADPEWLAQVDAGGTERWWRRDRPLLPQVAARARTTPAAVTRLVLLQLGVWRLWAVAPPIPILRPPPSQWSVSPRPRRAGVDPKLLTRVQALLAKAEATEFPEEGEALAGKAQELMTRYAIDVGMLDPELAVGAAEGRRIGVEDPYARQKVGLLSAVGRANRCQVVYFRGMGSCTVFGMPADLELVELLHTSLLLQATRAMLGAGTPRDALGRATTRSFRTSFLAAFAARISHRLEEASQTATTEAEHEYGPALLPVLAKRSDAVQALVDEVLPRTRRMRATTISDGRGWTAGLAAADAADLGGPRLRNAPRALGG
jgi:hypothetical protein